ncbi:Diuretic hormone receptor [Araneus ventricosus]|uniref:Diuretic hormone receptor n=1 Tax=Araneus ventricosus TaxID=182803 RepID=A0A4Y2AGT7_ARAVE|nr:Diuretic hormone receptor [Araneus ventricosus]
MVKYQDRELFHIVTGRLKQIDQDQEEHHPALPKHPDDFCNTTWDGLSCWPATKAGTTVVIKCMEFLNRVPYDTMQNATRECHANGTWAARSDYSECRPLEQKDESFEVLWDVKDAHTIYSIGYGISLIALAIALWIFMYFSDLRCLRNTIHTNLLVTYLFIDLTWIITAALQTSTSHEANKKFMRTDLSENWRRCDIISLPVNQIYVARKLTAGVTNLRTQLPSGPISLALIIRRSSCKGSNVASLIS